ncbi:hypothetical protein O9929_23370 [Vibrio lentus]|nr:hypothetical protein [Vibrio lentus]
MLLFGVVGRHKASMKQAFGKPAGKRRLHQESASVEFGPWGLRREFTLLDEKLSGNRFLIQIG